MRITGYLLIAACLTVAVFIGVELRAADQRFKREREMCSRVAHSLRMDALSFEGSSRRYKTHVAQAWDFDSYRAGPSVLAICAPQAILYSSYSRCLTIGVAQDDWKCASYEAIQLARAIETNH